MADQEQIDNLTPVDEKVCRARMETLATSITHMARDVEETREGVGNLNRKLFEGNGAPAHDVQIAANTAFRKEAAALLKEQRRDAAEARKDEKKRRRVAATAWAIAGAGWTIAGIFTAVTLLF